MALPTSLLCLFFLASVVICDESKLFAGNPAFSLKFAFPKDSKTNGLELHVLKGVVPPTFTFECWIYVPVSAPDNWPIISHVPTNHWNEPANGYNDYMVFVSGKNITLIMGGGANPKHLLVLYEKVGITTGQWGHFAMVVQHTSRDNVQKLDVSLHYDDQEHELATLLNPTRQEDSNSPIWLGFMRNQDPQAYFFGTAETPCYMDEIRFWSSARTKKQILEFSRRFIDVAPADLLLYYTVDESLEEEPRGLIDHSLYARHMGLPDEITKDLMSAPISLSVDVPYDCQFFEIKLIGTSSRGPTVPEYVISSTNFSGSAFLSFCPREECRINATAFPIIPSNYVYFSSGIPTETPLANLTVFSMSFDYQLVAGKGWPAAVPKSSNVATMRINLKRENQKFCGDCTICGVVWPNAL